MTELPTTFGKYYLTEKLATGGMAEIYLAKLIGPGGFEKSLVIKQIHPRLSGQRHFVDLFVAEAKTLVSLAHGNIVPVYELGVVDDTYFIAMDYIDGPTLYRLTEIMARREAVMEPPVAAWITARVLDGLDYAHRKGEGVIHRDLSPRNVMLSRDGEVKLVDFGIAVTLGEPGEGNTEQSAPTGSFPYMSPEQVRREPLTGQTDLFSVGVLCWEMLVGRRLFARGEPDATLDAVLRGEIPRPSSVRAEIPAKLDEVVMRALERDRDKRWPSAGEMLAAINKYIYSLEETPGPRDVAALVARFCPPESRRLPTNVDVAPPEAAPAEGAVPRTAADAPSAPAGPSTAVIPRDAQAAGRRPRRQQTFATHVELEHMLDRATPMLGTQALPDATPDLMTDAPRDVVKTVTAEGDEIDRPGIVAPKLTFPGRSAPGRGFLILMGVGAIALAALSVLVFYQRRHVVWDEREDAGVADATVLAPATPDTALPDAAAPDAARIEAAADAGSHPPRAVRDAAVAPIVRADAAAGSAAPHGTATLKIGADPWGEIYVDGRHIGQTPRELTVAAGHHAVEIVFPAETPPRKQTFSVDLAPGEAKPLQADFH